MIKILLTILLMICSIITFTKAEYKIDSIHNLIKNYNTDQKIRILIQSSFENSKKNLTNALIIAKEANNLAKNNKLLYYEVLSSLNVGVIYVNSNQLDSGYTYYNYALEKSLETQIDTLIGRSNFSLADIFYKKSNFLKAIELYQIALTYYKKANIQLWLGNINLNIGSFYKSLADYDKAIEYIQIALKMFEGIQNSEGMAKCYLNLGIIYKNVKQTESALNYYQKCYDLSAHSNDKLMMSKALNNMGVVYKSLKNVTKAIEYYEKALAVFTELNDKKNMAVSLNNIGNIYEGENKHSKALNYFLKALDLNQEIHDQRGVAMALYNIGMLQITTHNETKGIENIEKSILSCQKGSFNDILLNSYQYMADFYKNRSNYSKAYTYLNLLNELKDKVYNFETSKKLAELNANLESEKKSKENLLLKQNLRIKDLELAYRNTILYTLALISIILIIAIFIWYKFRENKRSQIYDQKNLEFQLQSLRLQMNPHFMFNSINSISYLISRNEPEKAQTYLFKFSRLMRMILENSDKNLVSIQEELESLKNYLDLESLRFDDKFQYKIIIDENINIQKEEIPAMLIQPYIENAIVHGLIPKNQNGEIKLEIHSENDLYHCIITDNGIGRQKALQLKNSSANPHKSIGMSVTKSRLELINIISNIKITEKVTDLFDNENNPIGTQIDIFIPRNFS